MKALSLWQPWASLVAVGAKRIETRHWHPPAGLIGERIAIHAAKRKPRAMTDRMHCALGGSLAMPTPALPLGAIVCTVRLARVEPITAELCRALSNAELTFGNYIAGRYAWHLTDVHRLETPIPTIGRQGFFDVDGLDVIGGAPPGPGVIREAPLYLDGV